MTNDKAYCRIGTLAYKHIAGWLLASCLWATSACDSSDALPNGYFEVTEQGASSFVMEGYTDRTSGFNVFTPTGWGSRMYIESKAFKGGEGTGFIDMGDARLDGVGECPAGGWQATVPIVEGHVYWAAYRTQFFSSYLKLRVAYMGGNNVSVEYVAPISENTNTNSNYGYMAQYSSVCNLEIPALQETAGIYREHYVDFKGRHLMNFATEWNAEMRHARWVAFSFDATNSLDNVSRTDMWAWDTAYDFSTMGGVEEADHKSDGFDKGHLCASEDRVYCKEANEQTFLYTNISPQIGLFNQKFWMYLEKRVQTWGRSSQTGAIDKLYVVKGGTLNDLLINFTGTVKGGDGLYPTTDADGLTLHGLPCPAYYYMALLAEKNGNYSAMAFLVPHLETLPQEPTSDDFKQYAVSIDQLESKTGIDFFCNLPDDVEREVEAAYSQSDWSW